MKEHKKKNISNLLLGILASISAISPMVSRASKSFIKERQTYGASETDDTMFGLENSTTDNSLSMDEMASLIGSSLPTIIPALDKAVCHEQIRFAREYFRNLKQYYPTNNASNCGYVSMAMLLSYYSLLWDPCFLPGRFRDGYPCVITSTNDGDYESPGVRDYADIGLWTGSVNKPTKLLENIEKKRIELSIAKNGNGTSEEIERIEAVLKSAYKDYEAIENRAFLEYVQRMINVKDTSIIGYLYYLATITYNSEGSRILDLNNHPSARIGIDDAKAILERYFLENGLQSYVSPVAVSYSDFGEETNSVDHHNQLTAAEEDHVCQGKPLMVGGRLYDQYSDYFAGDGHLAIAYDYCYESGDIYGHMGWKQGNWEHVNLSPEFRFNDDFLYFDVSPLLKHTHNKAFNLMGASKCSCELGSHNHYFTDWFDFGNSTLHARQCSCGEIEYSPHKYVQWGPNLEKCFVCKKTRVVHDNIWRP